MSLSLPNIYSLKTIKLLSLGMRPKDEEKRAAIKEATFALVAESGVVALKMADIAKKAGISPSTLYVYFEDKESLILILFEEVTRSLAEAVLPEYKLERPFKVNLRHIWIKYLTYRIENYNAIQFFERVKTSPFHHAAIEIRSGVMDLPLQIIRAGKAQLLLKDLDDHLMMAVLGGITERMTEVFVRGEMVMTEESLEACFVLLWDSLKS